MRVVVTSEAALLLESRKRWWRENRPATADLFETEFVDTVAVVADRPAIVPVTFQVAGRQIRRVLMEKTACHLYYEIDEEAGVVRIISAWGAVQGKPPRL